MRMVADQVEARGIRNAKVLAALREVPRERFVPSEARRFADADRPLPIGFGQTISQPYIVAYMTERLQVERSHRVLEIGTGSGYQTAVLATLSGHVFSIEIVPELALRAEEILRELGYTAPVIRHGDGYAGWPEQAPFDRILLTASPPEVPAALLDQLAVGGRLVAPVGRVSENQELILAVKDRRGRIRTSSLLPVRFVPMVRGDGRN